MFKPNELRARFAEIKVQVEAIESASAPLREKRDRHVQKAREAEDKMNAEIKAAEAGLFDLKQEMGMIVRALNGKTGTPKTEAE